MPERSEDIPGFQLTIDDVLVLEELARADAHLDDLDALSAFHLMRAWYQLHPEQPGARRFGWGTPVKPSSRADLPPAPQPEECSYRAGERGDELEELLR